MIKDGKPLSVENGHIDDGLLADKGAMVATDVLKWIRENIRHSDNVLECRTSYGMKHVLQQDTGIYLTNNQFKDAMMISGYEPVDANELNWTYKIDFIPDLNENPNPFFIWVSTHLPKRNSKEMDFVEDMLSDRNFPTVAVYDAIMKHLVYANACDEAIKAFKRLWRKYLKEM